MENSLVMAIVALLVAFLALPTSYWVAIRQVKVGLDEYEHRNKQRARLLVADGLDEFFKVFYGAVKELTGIESNELQQRLVEINPRMREIDAFVGKTKALERLALAIDNLLLVGFDNLSQSSELKDTLQSVRNQIALGSSDTTRYATL